MALIETRAVCKHFKASTGAEVRAVDDVSVVIKSGQFVHLSGASGSGKTTLLAMLGALERPTRGQVLFEGRDLAGCTDMELARVRRRIGFVFQNLSLIAGLPVWENITYPLIPRGIPRAERHARAAALLGTLGMKDKLDARPEELSGGEQQRVAIARALAGRPAVLLADEPTSNLDDEAATAILDLLQQFHREGATIILASHDARARGLATVAYELVAGRLAASGGKPAPRNRTDCQHHAE
jgi:putative ABC transport system ATP-binding protein